MIVCIGDSLTYGQKLDHPLSEAWPLLLDHQKVPDRKIASAGVPGDTTRLGLERFPAHVQAQRPSIVIIQFGHNDCNRWMTDRGLPRVSLAAYRANLVEMIERCRVFDAKPVLCSLTPSLRSNRHIEDVAIYDRMLRRVADEESVPVADVRAEFLKHRLADLLMPDGLHLSVEGHKVYAGVVQATLDEMGG